MKIVRFIISLLRGRMIPTRKPSKTIPVGINQHMRRVLKGK